MTFGRNEILVGVAILAVAMLIVVPVVLSSNRHSRRDEVPRLVEAIRQAEITYHDAFSDYVSAEAAPRPGHAVGPDAVAWVPSEGFRKLSWSPDEDNVYGSYQVQALPNGFKVVGSCDVDGDGDRAVFEATLDEAAHPVTATDVY
jgi:type II secretory pathway pseudopilin PulG